jgi:hypothetical protein
LHWQVHEELQGYDELIAKFQAAPVTDWESIVSSRRGDLGTEFFGHLNSRVQALHVRDTQLPAGMLPEHVAAATAACACPRPSMQACMYAGCRWLTI